MSNYGNIAKGIVTVLEANIGGLKAFHHPVDSANHFPCAIVLPEPIDVEAAFAGNSFTGNMRVVFLLASAESWEGFDQLYDYIDTVENQKSIIKAVRTDRTLNATVDDSDVIRIENIGRRLLWGGDYFGFDAIIEFVKTVA